MTNLEIINLLQRITGIIALGLLAIQIYRDTNKILIYIFVFIHPFLLILFRYFLYGRLEPYYTFIDVCILCGKVYEHYINLGRIAFYLIIAATIFSKFKYILNGLKFNWKKLHFLNYIAFYFVSFHSMLIGTDSNKPLFRIYFIFLQIIVLISIVKKIKNSKLFSS